MSLRYLIRRSNAQDFNDIRTHVPKLDEELGDAGVLVGPQAGLHRSITVQLSPTRSLQYTFFSKKTEKGQEWICPSLELVAESETELRQMCTEHDVKNLDHFRH